MSNRTHPPSISTSPLVSILIPCFNAQNWVAAAIESALAQTYRNIEVLIVDDGSTDKSLEVIQSFGDRVRWWSGPNHGGNAARNQLLELSAGEWIQYLDADDWLMPSKVGDQIAATAKCEGADVIYAPVVMERHGNGQISTSLLPIPRPHDPWILLARWYLPQTGGPLWRRSALCDVGGWAANQPCCQEHELYLRLLMAGRSLAYVEAAGAVYRFWGSGTVSTRNQRLVMEERLKIEQRIETHLLQTNAMTDARLDAVNQARFEIARAIWPSDRNRALEIVGLIDRSSAEFRPVGNAAPLAYRLAYDLFGFEIAERIAGARRHLSSRLKLKHGVRPGHA